LVCVAESWPVCRLVSRPVSRQTCLLIFRPVCYSAGPRMGLSAARVSPARGRQRGDVLPGCRRRGKVKAEADGYPDSWCVGDRPGHRVVDPVSLVLILLVSILLVSILPVWSEKKQVGARKGVPWAEQSPQDGRTRDHLVSADRLHCSVDRSVHPQVDRLVDWGRASARSETVAWGRTEPKALAVHPLVSRAVIQSAFPAALHPAPRHRCFAVHGVSFPGLARRLAGNCGGKDTRAVGRLAFPAAVVSSTPCGPLAWLAWFLFLWEAARVGLRRAPGHHFFADRD
jgi:hypothetical protein